MKRILLYLIIASIIFASSVGNCFADLDMEGIKMMIEKMPVDIQNIDFNKLEAYIIGMHYPEELIKKMSPEMLERLIVNSQERPEDRCSYLFSIPSNTSDIGNTIRRIAVYSGSEMVQSTACFDIDNKVLYYALNENVFTNFMNADKATDLGEEEITTICNVVNQINWNDIEIEYQGEAVVGGVEKGIAVETDKGAFRCVIKGIEDNEPKDIKEAISSLFEYASNK